MVLSSVHATDHTKRYTTGEEIANAVTHGVAALMSIAGLAILVGFAVAYSGSPTVITAVSVFGASMIFLYVASTLYHAIPNPKAKQILQRLDHSMIYVLIAGSYTPFCLVTLEGVTGIALCKRKKVDGEKPKGFFDRVTTFIKNNVGVLSAGAMLPVLAEELKATSRGNKLAKQLLSPENYKKVVKSNRWGATTYALAVVGAGLAAHFANKVKDKIAAPEKIK